MYPATRPKYIHFHLISGHGTGRRTDIILDLKTTSHISMTLAHYPPILPDITPSNFPDIR